MRRCSKMRRPAVPRLIASSTNSVSLLKFIHSSLAALLPKTKLPSSLASLVHKMKVEERKEERLAWVSKNKRVGSTVAPGGLGHSGVHCPGWSCPPGAAVAPEPPEPPRRGCISLSTILADSQAAPANGLPRQGPGGLIHRGDQHLGQTSTVRSPL